MRFQDASCTKLYAGSLVVGSQCWTATRALGGGPGTAAVPCRSLHITCVWHSEVIAGAPSWCLQVPPGEDVVLEGSWRA